MPSRNFEIVGAAPARSVDWLIATASWEPRFSAGFARLLRRRHVRRVLLLRYTEWSRWSKGAVAEAQNLCAAKKVACDTVSLSYLNPKKTLLTLAEHIDKAMTAKSVIFDITTTPREAIWWILTLLRRQHAVVTYSYHLPEGYADWLSRDPVRPRLVLKHSGESLFGQPTALVALIGYDPHRTEQLIRTFEPSVVLLGLQSGTQFQNPEHRQEHLEYLRAAVPRFDVVNAFEVDAYSADHGYAAISAAVEPIRSRANIVLASLGPKLSAVGIHRLHADDPSLALAYTPSQEFNFHYSHGIGPTHFGSIVTAAEKL